MPELFSYLLSYLPFLDARYKRGRRPAEFYNIGSSVAGGPVPQEGGGLGWAWTLQGLEVPQVPKLR